VTLHFVQGGDKKGAPCRDPITPGRPFLIAECPMIHIIIPSYKVV